MLWLEAVYSSYYTCSKARALPEILFFAWQEDEMALRFLLLPEGRKVTVLQSLPVALPLHYATSNCSREGALVYTHTHKDSAHLAGGIFTLLVYSV